MKAMVLETTERIYKQLRIDSMRVVNVNSGGIDG